MKATEQTLQMLDRMIRKLAEKFPPSEEMAPLTDLHLRVTQETGELMVFDDDENEITRCVVEQWIDNKDDDFYQSISATLHKSLEKHRDVIDNLAILKPYAFVLEDDDHENKGELYVADDDTVIISPELMAGLDDELNTFLKNLMKE